MTQTKAELLQTRHQGDIRLGDADSTNYVGFKAPSTVSSSLVWTLPAADGTANYLLKTDGSGNLGWVADSSTDSTKMPLAGGTFTGNTIYNDNVKSIFGTGSDLQIYHDGTNNNIDTTTGELRINSVGATKCYYGSDIIWYTQSDGSTHRLRVHDNTSIDFGNASDLRIYHDGSNSYIKDTGTGNLKIDGSDNVELQAGGSTKAYTYANGLFVYDQQIPDNGELNIGNGSDLKLYHDGTNSFITSATGTLKVTGGISQAATAVGALQLDLSTSNYFTKTISGNSTFTFANPAASGTVTAFTLELTHSSGTVTWPSEVKWNADTAPTLTTGKTHLFMFVTDDAGSRYRGSALVDYVN